MSWVVVTGGGSGIGRGLVHHFSRSNPVLTCGRRLQPLQETQQSATDPGRVVVVQADIGTEEGRRRLVEALPASATVGLLVHNAAIGDPAPFTAVDPRHLEEALRVNVVAPLALTQAFLPALLAGHGRVLHLGTSVAHNPQAGTLVYGVTKSCFHRLYQQLNAEQVGVPCASLSPGMVDTEGLADHLNKARQLGLPHVRYFDEAYDKGLFTDLGSLMEMVDHMLGVDGELYAAKEWKYSVWKGRTSTDPSKGSFGEKAE